MKKKRGAQRMHTMRREKRAPLAEAQRTRPARAEPGLREHVHMDAHGQRKEKGSKV